MQKYFIRSKNPDSTIGTAGPLQGLNTGVGLLNLARMRTSKVLNDFLKPDVMDKLADKFMFVGALGHQVPLLFSAPIKSEFKYAGLVEPC